VIDQRNADITYDDLVLRGRGQETPSCHAFVFIFVGDGEQRCVDAEGLSTLVIERLVSRLGAKRVATASLGAATFTAEEVAAFLSLEHSRGSLARAIAGVQASAQLEPVALATGSHAGPVLRQVNDLLRDYRQRRRRSTVGDRKVHFHLSGEEGEDNDGADDDEDDDVDDDSSTTCRSAHTTSPLTGILPTSPAARRGLGPPPSSAPPPPPLPAVAADHDAIARSVEATGSEVTGKTIEPGWTMAGKRSLPAPQEVEAEQVQAQALAAASPSAVAATATAPPTLKNRRKGAVVAGSRAAAAEVAKEPRRSNAATTTDIGKQAHSQSGEISCRSGSSSSKAKAIGDGTSAFARALQQHNTRRSESLRKSKGPTKEKISIAEIPPKLPLFTELWVWLVGVAASFGNFIASIRDVLREMLMACRSSPKAVLGTFILLQMVMLMHWLHTVERPVKYAYDPYPYGIYPGWGYAQGSYDADAYYDYFMALQAMHGAPDEYSEEYRKAMEELWVHDGWDSRQRRIGDAPREAMSKDSSDVCPAQSELELLRKAFTGQFKSRNRQPMCKLKAAAPAS